MNKIILILSFLFIVLGKTLCNNFEDLDFIEIPTYTLNVENTLSLKVDYADDILVSNIDLELLKNNSVSKIELVYTRFKQDSSFNQQKLNNKRIIQMKNRLSFIDFDSIDIQLVEQTAATSLIEARSCFHGFVFHFEEVLFKSEIIRSHCI